MKANLTYSKPEHSTVEYVYGEIHLIKSTIGVDAYQRVAKNLLNKLSKEYDPSGIEFLLTALIEEMENGNFGNENGR